MKYYMFDSESRMYAGELEVAGALEEYTDVEQIVDENGDVSETPVTRTRTVHHYPANATETPPPGPESWWDGSVWVPADAGKLAEIKAAAAETVLARATRKTMAEEADLSDAELLVVAAAGYFDAWEAETAYVAGKRLMHEDALYVVMQDVTAQAHQPPGVAGMLAVYRPVAEESGTEGDAVPFVLGMDVEAGKYYSYEGNAYLAKADMKPCVWAPGTVGLWQWELVAA